MHLRPLLLSTALLCFAMECAGAAFQNGSFENGAVPPHGGVTLFTGSTAISGWVVLPGSVDWIDFAGNTLASHGTWYLDLNGTSVGGIQQTFDTVAGTSYSVTFDMNSNDSDLLLTPRSMRVSAAGSSQDFTFQPTILNGGTPWATHTFSFTANSSSTTLVFQSLSQVRVLGPMLDNVNVSVTPEPGSPVMLALFAVAAMCRRFWWKG